MWRLAMKFIREKYTTCADPVLNWDSFNRVYFNMESRNNKSDTRIKKEMEELLDLGLLPPVIIAFLTTMTRCSLHGENS
jgi:hypothetical protein